MPFPSLIIGLIAKTRLKLPSNLTIVQRDYSIGAHTLKAQLTSKDPKSGFLKYQRIVLRKRKEIQKRRLRDSPLH